jgi:hypothetical protein
VSASPSVPWRSGLVCGGGRRRFRAGFVRVLLVHGLAAAGAQARILGEVEVAKALRVARGSLYVVEGHEGVVVRGSDHPEAVAGALEVGVAVEVLERRLDSVSLDGRGQLVLRRVLPRHIDEDVVQRAVLLAHVRALPDKGPPLRGRKEAARLVERGLGRVVHFGHVRCIPGVSVVSSMGSRSLCLSCACLRGA